MKKGVRICLICFLVLVLLASICAMIYPLFYSWYSQRHNSELKTEYQDQLKELDDLKRQAALIAAQEYNSKLFAGNFSPLEYEQNGYHGLLNITGTGIMGFLDIPKIRVSLPIYHGIGAEVLAVGVGHLPQTSLPVGGESCHAVLSAHTGTTSQPLFTDLILMEVGDLFYLTVLGEKLTYQVDQITTVLPQQVDDIQIHHGEDYITLVTCTPYGVNSHRLLVRGTRIHPEESTDPADPEATKGLENMDQPEATSVWMQHYLQGILYGTGIATVLILLLVVIRHFKKRRKTH